jgi:hypothetical protein
MKRGTKTKDFEKEKLQCEVERVTEALCESSIELLLLKKKRELGLNGDLPGRHLSASQREIFLNSIFIGKTKVAAVDRGPVRQF